MVVVSLVGAKTVTSEPVARRIKTSLFVFGSLRILAFSAIKRAFRALKGVGFGGVGFVFSFSLLVFSFSIFFSFAVVCSFLASIFLVLVVFCWANAAKFTKIHKAMMVIFFIVQGG